MPVVYHVRYIGPPKSRRMLIQRSDDHAFWDGKGWVEEVNRALLFCTLRDTQAEAAKLQAVQIEKLPRREFRCRLSVAVYGGGRATTRDVAAYLSRLMVIGIDYEGVEIDSPLAEAEAHVNCKVELGGLKEVKPRLRRKPPRPGRPEVGSS